MRTNMTFKHIGAVMLGRMTSIKKAHASRENGKKGGYWKQKRNLNKKPKGLNARYEGYTICHVCKVKVPNNVDIHHHYVHTRK